MGGKWMVAVLGFTSACVLEPPGHGQDGASTPVPHPRPDAGPDAGPYPIPDAGPPTGPDAGPSGECEPRDDLRDLPVTPDNLPDVPLTTEELLGQLLFFDTNISTPTGQSCAVCHLG